MRFLGHHLQRMSIYYFYYYSGAWGCMSVTREWGYPVLIALNQDSFAALGVCSSVNIFNVERRQENWKAQGKKRLNHNVFKSTFCITVCIHNGTYFMHVFKVVQRNFCHFQFNRLESEITSNHHTILNYSCLTYYSVTLILSSMTTFLNVLISSAMMSIQWRFVALMLHK